MKFFISQSINWLNDAVDKDVFSQMCAIGCVEKNLDEIRDSSEIKSNSFLQDVLKEIRKITKIIQDGKYPPEVNKYMFECIITRLKYFESFSSNLSTK